jgi:hypothetical protein
MMADVPAAARQIAVPDEPAAWAFMAPRPQQPPPR